LINNAAAQIGGSVLARCAAGALDGWRLRGMLVELPRRKGIGKLESAADGRCTVSVFHSILRAETIELSSADIARAYLSPQTRVYVRHDECFRVGRVTNYLMRENGLVDYEVRFPNGKQSDFSEVDLFVRPWDAPEDPAEILAAGGAESQFLHDRRESAIRPLLALRSATQGLTSLISAGVDLVPYQVAAVRRVLTDPVQRYLLADEVGLGKTIEAGLIIRQHLIDNPNTEVLIAAPPHLCQQWRRELVDKIRLDQFGEAFECCSHADLASISRAPDILVVDEAHHLVGLKGGQLVDRI
jgi:ATP-dependent helicase HepA